MGAVGVRDCWVNSVLRKDIADMVGMLRTRWGCGCGLRQEAAAILGKSPLVVFES